MAGILSACGLSGDKVFSGEHEGIIVGSAAFAESQILAEIYAGALARAGFNARTQLSIGAREAYLGALASGAVDVIPDYSGNLLLYLDPKATANTAQEILQALPADTAKPARSRRMRSVSCENPHMPKFRMPARRLSCAP